MKALAIRGNKYVFRLENKERDLLKLLLGLYPVIPSAHQPFSKSAPDIDHENQRLLDEALADQRKENKDRLQSFLSNKKHLVQLKSSCRLVVTAEEIDWLLQVLNDVRVGNWILLGSPDEDFPTLKPK